MQASQTTVKSAKKDFYKRQTFLQYKYTLEDKKTFSIRDIFAPKLDTNLYDDETVKYVNLFPLGKATFYHRDSVSRDKA